MSYRINSDELSVWIGEWEGSFTALPADTSSLKTMIFLSLLERQNEESSYQDIVEQWKGRRVFEGTIDNSSLRNSMFQVVKALNRDNLYALEKSKRGKEALYRLRRRESVEVNGLSGQARIVTILNPDESASMDYIAERLIRDHRMPLYGVFLPMRAASRWVLYSEQEAEDRRQYEAEQLETLLSPWLSKYRNGEVSLVGLGVGEGIGEIELIENLLNQDSGFKRVYYCAIDINVHFLLDHVERIRDKFKNEIKDKRLICGVICGNFLTSFSQLISDLRQEFRRLNQFDDLTQGFLPNTSGTMISILGNLVGNLEHRASEWKYFQPILETLKGHDLAFLIGVSVQQTSKGGKIIDDRYTRELDDLMLATPRYLMHELGLLKSGQPLGSIEAAEFVLPVDPNKKEQRCPSVKAARYQGDGIVRGIHIKGSIYEFFYVIQWGLTMEAREETLEIPEETNLLLYNIIKFDLTSLIAFLESKGLKAPSRSIKTHEIETENGKRVYAVFAVTT